MYRQTRNAEGYYIDDGVYTAPPKESSKKNSGKTLNFMDVEELKPRKKKQLMTRMVNYHWYRRYAHTLPENERIYHQPKRELTKEEVARISQAASAPALSKVETMLTKMAEDRARKVDAVLRVLEKKNSSKLLDRLGLTTKHRSSLVLDKPLLNEKGKIGERRMTRRMTKMMSIPIKSKWLLVKNNPIIRSKIKMMALSLRVEHVRHKWKKAMRTVLAMIRFGAILHDIARTTESVFRSYDTMKDGLSENSNTFDKSKFKPSIPKIYCLDEATKMTLRSEESRRTDSEVHEAMLHLRKLRSFCAFPAFIQLILTKIGQYQKIPKDRVILREGQPPQCFYFLISGKVVTTKLVGSPEYCKLGGFEVVRTINSDSIFATDGLFGLEYRETTATSFENCELLSIAIDDYHRLTLECDPYQNPEHIRFVSQLDFMRYFPTKELLTDADNGNIIIFYFAPEQFVTKDICASKYIFIVKTGSCDVLVETYGVVEAKRSTNTLLSWLPPEEFGTEKDDLEKEEANEMKISKLSSGASQVSTSTLENFSDPRSSGPQFPALSKRKKTIHAASLTKNKVSVCAHLVPDGYHVTEPNNDPNVVEQLGFPPSKGRANRKSLPQLFINDDAQKLQVNVQKEYENLRKKTFGSEMTADEKVSLITATIPEDHKMTRIQSASCWEKTIRSNAPTRNPTWVYLKELRETDSIGLETMDWGDSNAHSKIAVVSGGSVVVAIKKSFLLDNANAKMRAHIRASSYIFPTNGQLHAELKRLSLWRSYHEKVMNERRKHDQA